MDDYTHKHKSSKHSKRKHRHKNRDEDEFNVGRDRWHSDDNNSDDYDYRNDRKRQKEHKHKKRHKENREEYRPIEEVRVKKERESSEEPQRRCEERRNDFSMHDIDRLNEHNPIKQERKPQAPKVELKVNMELSGKLTEDANTYNGITIKYSEPPEARKPKKRWRWYIFKGDQELPFLPLHRQSAYLIGRERRVADIPIDHPSCSKQHAVLQYRLVPFQRSSGEMSKIVRPYIIDLESANGTFVNNRKIEAKRYFELMEKDVVKFGYSSREYVMLHEGSKGEDEGEVDE